MPVPLPPLEIQREIVVEIEGYQKIIDGARQVVENWKPQIEIDPEWPMVKLGEVCEIKSGGTPSKSKKEYWNGEINWYSSGELNTLFTSEPKEKITALGLKNSNANIFAKGSLLIGMYDTAAFKMSILDREGAFNQAICGIKPNINLNLIFLYLYFSMRRDFYLSHRMGVRQRNLSKGYIEAIEIPLPPLKVQQELVRKIETERVIIDGCRDLIKIYEEKIKHVINKVWEE
jgi:restriction endonuclease S subunit